MILQLVKDLAPVPSCGILALVVLSCVLFALPACFHVSPAAFSVDASVFSNGRIHKLLTYSCSHQTSAQLLVNIAALVSLCGSLEKGFGTVRFLFFFAGFSAATGLFYSLQDLLRGGGEQNEAEGLLPAILACVTLTTTHTKVAKGFLCGISFPAMALPWMLLIIASFLPRSSLPCNIIATLLGWMHGKGWFSHLQLSEAKAGVLEKTMPFRLLRGIGGVMFVPASTEERRKTILPQINPTPGSYPVQSYAPLSSLNAVDSDASFHEGWPNATSISAGPKPPPELNRLEVRQTIG